MSLEGARIGRALRCKSDQHCAFAQEEDVLEDLLLRTVGNREISPSGSTQSINDDDDILSIAITDINYCRLVTEGSKRRVEMESLGQAG
jgi:hypothetical protein